jgi:hypothetical protein
MKLFLYVSGFQDCLKIQLDLNKLSEWCDRNSLLLNVGKCMTITFARSRHPVEFSYMLSGTVLDRVSSKNTFLVRPKLEYASCVWNPFYDVCVDRVERVQMQFIRYALLGLSWMDMHDTTIRRQMRPFAS